jgi:hypothetical protein
MGSSVVIVVTDDRVTVPEAARRFSMDGVHLYELILNGDVEGRPDRDGQVLVSVSSIEMFLKRHATPS